MWPLGRATTARPFAARRTGTITIVSSPRTTTPPAENSRLRRPPASVDIKPESDRVVDGQEVSPLRDDAGALEGGQEAAGRLAAGARELGHVGLGGGEQDVALARALRSGLVHELGDDGRHPALHGLEALAREALVGGAQPPSQRGDELDGDLVVVAHQAAHVGAEDREGLERVDGLDRGRAALVVEHRQLAEEVARAERRQRDRAAVWMLADRPRVPDLDDVARVAGVALPEHHL